MLLSRPGHAVCVRCPAAQPKAGFVVEEEDGRPQFFCIPCLIRSAREALYRTTAEATARQARIRLGWPE